MEIATEIRKTMEIITKYYDFDTNTGYFMQPNAEIIDKLNMFYKDYDLDYYDADVISSAE